jgi:putative photosynthetic complex assembly protein 2
MADLWLPVLFTLLLWWASTGLILHLDGLRRETFGRSMAVATALLLAALVGQRVASADGSAAGAYIAFTCGLIAWGWIELGFLTGWITGPRREACPPGARGWPRLRATLAAILWHELAILGLAATMALLAWDRPNQIGTWTFLLLWAMRTSAKLNLYLGVRNLGEVFLPPHLRYISSYLARRPMNPLFPLSVTAGTLLGALLFHGALAPSAGPGEAAGYAMLGTLTALAVLEHWFLVLPVPVEALWRWGLRSHAATAAETSRLAWAETTNEARKGRVGAA